MKDSRRNYLLQCALGMCKPKNLTPKEQEYLDILMWDIAKTKEQLGPDADKVAFSIPCSLIDDDEDDDDPWGDLS